MTINPTAHADAILAWMENEIGTVSRDELRARIEQEVRDVARRAYEDAAVVADGCDKTCVAGAMIRERANSAVVTLSAYSALKTGL